MRTVLFANGVSAAVVVFGDSGGNSDDVDDGCAVVALL